MDLKNNIASKQYGATNVDRTTNPERYKGEQNEG